MNHKKLCSDIFTFLFSDSDSESSSDDESLDEYELPRYKKARIEHYVPNVVDNYTDVEFQQNFRINRRTFEYILNKLKEDITSSGSDKGHPTYDAKIQLLVAIWYFATPDSYRSICCRFNIGKATGLRIVRRVTDALIKLSPSIITWPKDDYKQEVIDGFASMGMPNTIGCIDGSYISIPLPKDNDRSYINRKNVASIILQGVCDHRLLFTHCYAGEVGSLHDANVLKRSEIWVYMNERTEQMFSGDVHLLGDKAYPCTPQLMTPYKSIGHLTVQQQNYNYKHASTRTCIERAFGLLKNRWRILKFMDVRCLNWIPKYVIACCVLHNICILQEDVVNVDIAEENDELNLNDAVGDNPERRVRGHAKRNRLCLELMA